MSSTPALGQEQEKYYQAGLLQWKIVLSNNSATARNHGIDCSRVVEGLVSGFSKSYTDLFGIRALEAETIRTGDLRLLPSS